MKILHIAFSGLGGHGNVFFSMVDADIDKEHQYEVIFFGNEEVCDGYIKKAAHNDIPWHYVPKRPGLDLKAFSQIEAIIRNAKPDIIFLHSSSYIFAVKKATAFISRKIRIVVRETQANHLKTKMEWIGLSVSMVVADKVVFLSQEYRDQIKKKLAFLFSDKRTAVIPNGISLDIFKPALKPPGDFISIGMQSRVTPNKDHSTLIAAFALLLQQYKDKPLKLFIAGDGVCRQQLEKQAGDLGISDNVSFTGMLDEVALPGFINSLDIYVHATFGETMSVAIMQVMACGKPIIASDVQGVNNMVKHHDTGLLVPVKHPVELKEAMILLIQDNQLRIKLSENALAFATANYGNKRMLDRYNEVFHSAG